MKNEPELQFYAWLRRKPVDGPIETTRKKRLRKRLNFLQFLWPYCDADTVEALTFMSSTKEGNPPIDMNVTNPKTNDAHAPLACEMKLKNNHI